MEMEVYLQPFVTLALEVNGQLHVPAVMIPVPINTQQRK